LKYNAAHTEEKKIRDRAYFNRNIEAIRQQTALYYLNNKKAVIARRRVYQRERRHSDLIYKLQTSLRSRLNTAIKQAYKSGSAVSDLGCSIQQFKTYLESKFQPGMSWDNWSKTGWHIDHKIPLASFDLTDRQQFKKAAHFTNLQPMWAKDNLRKGARL